MKKVLFTTLIFSFFAFSAIGDNKLDSLKREYSSAKIDTTRYNLLYKIIEEQTFPGSENYNPDAITDLLNRTIEELRRKNDIRRFELFLELKAWTAYVTKKYTLSNQYYDSCILIANKLSDYDKLGDIYYGKYSVLSAMKLVNRSIRSLYIASDYYKKAGDALGESNCLFKLGILYFGNQQDDLALTSYLKSIKLSEASKDSNSIAMTSLFCAEIYIKQGNLKLAEEYLKKGSLIKDSPYLYQPFYYYFNYGTWLKAMNRNDEALKYLEIAANLAVKGNQRSVKPLALLEMAKIYIAKKRFNEAKRLLDKAIIIAKDEGAPMIDTRKLFAEYYEAINKPHKALEEYKIWQALKDSSNQSDITRLLESSSLEADYTKKEAELAEIQRIKDEKGIRKLHQQKLVAYSIGVVLFFVSLISFLLYRNNRQKQKANLVLTEQKLKVEITLRELKSTQTQLIQFEKMASLGELTAGIAHEIQNPLNFVNNFSEVNSELIDELEQEADKGNIDEIKIIAKDIKENSEKINHHGKRADAIVKGMLQHSRSSSGIKEPTDINALCDEYLRLSYHGLRAKDKDFNSDFKTEFYQSLPKINVIPQDIGRVLLNLINNAFYAVDQKAKENLGGCKPEVIVSTKKNEKTIEITVKDNGNGIPSTIKEKIFQPFFTTKPTGQGTGLGLSLSYDIIKAHGGELKVETMEGVGTGFTIQLIST